jgi:hypothetical protein
MSADQARSPGIEREKLLNDLESIRRYGDTHRGVLVQAWFENLPSARVVALLGGQGTDEYERDLRAMVKYPDQLDVRHMDRTPAELDRIRAEVTELVIGRFVQMGPREGILVVHLRADQAELARQLHDRYDGLVGLMVGRLPYPDAHAEGVVSRRKRFRPTHVTRARLPAHIEVSLVEKIEVVSGGQVKSQLRVWNRGSADIAVNTHGYQLTALVVDPATGEIVGEVENIFPAVLGVFEVPAGGVRDIPLLIGTASLNPDLGWAVPPGRWAIQVALPMAGDRHEVGQSPLLPIDIVA